MVNNRAKVAIDHVEKTDPCERVKALLNLMNNIPDHIDLFKNNIEELKAREYNDKCAFCSNSIV